MTTTTKETTTMKKKVKKLKKKTSLSSLFLVNFFNFFFYASFCVMKIERTEAHWKIADGLIISEVGTRAWTERLTSRYSWRRKEKLTWLGTRFKRTRR